MIPLSYPDGIVILNLRRFEYYPAALSCVTEGGRHKRRLPVDAEDIGVATVDGDPRLEKQRSEPDGGLVL